VLLSNRATSVTVTRATAGEYVDGDFQPGAPSALTIKAHVQPASGQEMLTFPEGERTREAIRLYVDQQLRAADEAAQLAADVVTYNGVAYQVQRVMPWPLGGLPHWKAIAFRIPPADADV
jgi:hypothetical protein